MKLTPAFMAIALSAAIAGLSEAHAQLMLTRNVDEIVITSDAGSTWKIVFAVSPQAGKRDPGGGIVRALHISANNHESVVPGVDAAGDKSWYRSARRSALRTLAGGKWVCHVLPSLGGPAI